MSTREYAYAGFWVRASARAVDFLVILGIYNLFYLVDMIGASAGLWAPGPVEDLSALTEWPSPENIARAIFFFGFPVFYYVYLHGSCGQTFGKMAFRIKVINEDGTPLNYRKALFRWMGYFLCMITLYAGYVLAAFDRRKQGLHDRVCRTLVIRTDA